MLLEREVVIQSTTAPGQGACVAAITILGDYIVEENEEFRVIIQPTNPLDMVSMGGNTTTVTIVDQTQTKLVHCVYVPHVMIASNTEDKVLQGEWGDGGLVRKEEEGGEKGARG